MTEKWASNNYRTNFIDKETLTIYSRHKGQLQNQQQIKHDHRYKNFKYESINSNTSV